MFDIIDIKSWLLFNMIETKDMELLCTCQLDQAFI
jgi:hypothetical protein